MGFDAPRLNWMVKAGVVVVLAAVALGFVALSLVRGPPDNTSSDGDAETLSVAVAQGNLDQVRLLLRQGAHPDEPRHHGFTPLMRAAMRDDATMIDLLLDAGADLDATDLSGLTAWHLAARTDAAEGLEALIDAGADLDIRSLDGMNTLDYAALGGSVDAIELVAAAGVDLDAQSEMTTGGHGYPVDNGPAALAIAARGGQIEAIEKLLELGADVDAPSAFGQTPLIVAVVTRQSPELVSVLLDAGADPTLRVRCISGCSLDEGNALEWARRLGHPGVIPLLEAAITEQNT